MPRIFQRVARWTVNTRSVAILALLPVAIMIFIGCNILGVISIACDGVYIVAVITVAAIPVVAVAFLRRQRLKSFRPEMQVLASSGQHARGWKVARVMASMSEPFMASATRTRYGLIGDAQGPGDGFFAFESFRDARIRALYRGVAVLRVELSGLVRKDPDRCVLEASHQLVVGSRLHGCACCVGGPLPRPAIGCEEDEGGVLRPSCGRHDKNISELDALEQTIGVNVTWFHTWLSRLSTFIWRN